MMAAVIVAGSIALGVVFIAAWIAWPDLRARIEGPKNAIGAAVPSDDGREPGRGWGLAIAVCALAGAVTVCVTLATRLGGAAAPVRGPAMPLATEEYGRRLLTATSVLLGPDQADAAMRYSGSRLQCASCHLRGGAEPGMLSLVEAFGKYPRFSGRDGVVGDLKLRIQRCMTRSMNGRALPDDGPEMTAMVSYIRVLSDRYAISGAASRAAHDPAAFKTPDRAADPEAGRRVFESRCAVCHGGDGQGLRLSTRPIDGYLYPPLWGPDSFNDGAGMHRVVTAARFIKARMPLGGPDLTDGQAFDVAAFINVQPRPEMPHLDRDYPDRTTKPADTPYGPYADSFPIEQHRLGPFAPIDAFYKALSKGK
jgi:thiosulfate dehydrogenase